MKVYAGLEIFVGIAIMVISVFFEPVDKDKVFYTAVAFMTFGSILWQLTVIADRLKKGG